MKPIIITGGENFTDIDGLASTLAYKDLLQKQGKQALVVLPGPLNHSVAKSLRKWKLDYRTTYQNENCEAVIMDGSDPAHIAKFVKHNNIVAIFNHHFGFNKYWQAKLKDKSMIEMIGACATLVWEEYKKKGFDKNISQSNANLLYTAIAANTLNFNAAITDQRDVQAFNELKNYINLPEDWVKSYYLELEKEVLANAQKVIANDTKVQQVYNLGITLVIGQIELWDSKKFIAEYRRDIEETLQEFGHPDWFLTSPSISEGKNYIFTKSEKVKSLLKKILKITFEEDLGVTP